MKATPTPAPPPQGAPAVGDSAWFLGLDALQRVTDGVFGLDLNWNYVFMNDAGASLVGRRAEDLIGRNIWREFPEAVGSEFDLKYREALATMKTVEFEARFDQLDKWYSVRVFPSADGLTIYYQDTTERHRADEALRASLARALDAEERYRSLLDSVAEGIVRTSPTGEILVANKAFAEMLGFESEQDLLANVANMADLYVDPAMREGYVDWTRHHTGVPIDVELLRHDGNRIWVRKWGAVARGPHGEITSIQTIVDDITDERAAEAATRQATELVTLAFDLNPMPLVMLDITQDQPARVTNANRALGRLLGFTVGELIGLDSTAFVNPEDAAMEASHLAEVLSGTTSHVHFETRRRHRDGHWIPVELTASTITTSDGRLFGIAALADITERREAQLSQLRLMNGAIGAVSAAAESRDPYTAGHQRRVADLAALIAVEMGLEPDEVEGVRLGATVHDIGKISVPSEYLARPGRLSRLEFELVQGHSRAGAEIIQGIAFPWPIAEMVLQHHERLDGSGYPDGLRGDQIGLGARIIAVADVVEAMSSFRPYRPSLGLDRALEEIQHDRGTLFDPAVVDACLTVLRERPTLLDSAVAPSGSAPARQ